MKRFHNLVNLLKKPLIMLIQKIIKFNDFYILQKKKSYILLFSFSIYLISFKIDFI